MNTIILATLYEATAQQVFDQAAWHLLTQGDKSLNASCDCAYRGEGGLKCAAGCFIADDEHNAEFEGKRWDFLVEEELIPSAHCDFIQHLQAIHDNEPVEDWADELRRLAERSGLSTAVLTEFAP